MKIEPGRTYRTRDGRKATDIERHPYVNEHPFVFHGVAGGSLHTWAENGHWFDDDPRDLDLVAEWTEPEDELATLQAENTRLREALERIQHEAVLRQPSVQTVADFRSIARAALQGEKK